MSTRGRVLALASAGVFGFIVVVGSTSVPLAAQQKDAKKLDKAQQQDAEALTRALDAVQAGQAAPSDIPIAVESYDALRTASGDTYVPFTVSVDDKTLVNQPVAVMFRVVADNATTVSPGADNGSDRSKADTAKAKAPYAYQDLAFTSLSAPADLGQPLLRVRRSFQAAPGSYQLYFALKERNTGDKKQKPRIAVCKQVVSLPDLKGDLTTSTIIFYDKVDVLAKPLPSDQQRDSPYTIGQLQFVPKVGTKFAKTQELSVFFQIYNEAIDAARKPNVQVDFLFYRRQGDQEKKIANSEPQILNANTLAPQFDPAIHQLPGGSSWPLANFAPGDYRLEIQVTDKVSGKTLTRSVTFSVS